MAFYAITQDMEPLNYLWGWGGKLRRSPRFYSMALPFPVLSLLMESVSFTTSPPLPLLAIVFAAVTNVDGVFCDEGGCLLGAQFAFLKTVRNMTLSFPIFPFL